jgi:hypothetical protein
VKFGLLFEGSPSAEEPDTSLHKKQRTEPEILLVERKECEYHNIENEAAAVRCEIQDKP